MKRLSKALAAAGVASRRKCETMIFEGRVLVNGIPVLVPQTLVSLEGDDIVVDGNLLKKEQERVYFMLNKPKGFICSSARVGSKRLTTDLFEHLPYRLFTVGRLDRDTTGLLLVTNDGNFAQAVIHPSKGFTKEYLIKVNQEITSDHLISLSKGCVVEGVWVKPVSVSKVRKGTFKVVIREGKKRELRILSQKAGLDVFSLHRIRIGPLVLGNLGVGEYRPLTENERAQLYRSELKN